jgi:hypothetical protein
MPHSTPLPQVLAATSHSVGVARAVDIPLGSRDPERCEIFVPRLSQACALLKRTINSRWSRTPAPT